jgi:GH43 family beta-xylosidase
VNTYKNPVYSGYFADPFVWRHHAEYFAIGTGHDEADGAVPTSDAPTVFPLLRSADLVHWSEAGRALIRPSQETGDTFWAPEIAFDGAAWWLYYSAGFEDRRHQLRVARSADPLGPYTDVGALTDRNECKFAIDPHPFRDDAGTWYLFHARDFLDETDQRGRPVRAGTALVVQRLHAMTQLRGECKTVARARCDWQRFAANRSMYGGVYDWHTLEGPFVVKHAGRFYCLYSGGCWQTDTYGVDYVVADSICGEYVDEGSDAGPRILRTVPQHVIGPGHCSVTRNDEGQHYLVYHAWDAQMTARRLCIDPLNFTAQGPRSCGPTWTAQRLSG